MSWVMNSNNILSLSGILLLGIVGQMAKAGLVNDNTLTGFAGQSKNIQRTVMTVVVVTQTPITTLDPAPISTMQRNLPAAAEVAPSTNTITPPTTPLDCNGAFEKIPLIFHQATLEKIQDCVTITGIVTFVHYYSPDGNILYSYSANPRLSEQLEKNTTNI